MADGVPSRECQVPSITCNKNIIDYYNTLHGNKLEHINTAKHLRITPTHDLHWNQHITNIINRVIRTLGFRRRNLQIHNPQIQATAYNTIVRPTVEYATSVWDHNTQVNIQKIEMVQRRVACFTLNRYRNRSSVTGMIEELG